MVKLINYKFQSESLEIAIRLVNKAFENSKENIGLRDIRMTLEILKMLKNDM